jgi:DNA-binding response OmpR family regulator
MARILVIDDDRQIRSLLRRMLERNGHEVVEAEDGTKGLAAFAARRPHLVVVDLYLPGLSGWETIRALQDAAPGIPFVLVSGGGVLEGLKKGSAGTLDSLRSVAPFRLLRKPFEWAELSAAVSALLQDGTPLEEAD